MVARQSVIGQKLRSIRSRWIVSTFKNRRAFIDFVEHGDVDHFAIELLCGLELRPQELSLQPGNGVEFRAVKVVPTETWIDNRQKIEAIVFAPGFVRLPDAGSMSR